MNCLCLKVVQMVYGNIDGYPVWDFVFTPSVMTPSKSNTLFLDCIAKVQHPTPQINSVDTR